VIYVYVGSGCRHCNYVCSNIVISMLYFVMFCQYVCVVSFLLSFFPPLFLFLLWSSLNVYVG